MIPSREVLALRDEWSLRSDVIEKDYVLGWLLAGIAATPELARSWVFKGGTCLRKCYYETYRFSEDLDFTVVPGGPETPEELAPIFGRIADWLADEAGIELVVEAGSFLRRNNLRGKATTVGRVGFTGPSRPPQPPKVKIDLTSDEVVVEDPVVRTVVHPYSDAPLPGEGVAAYSLEEVFAEKLRALAERCRPRDLYDVVHIQRHPELLDRAEVVSSILERKCAHAGIQVPSVESIRSSPFRAELEQEWGNMLAHQLPYLSPFEEFWRSIDDVFAWMRGEAGPEPLPRAEYGELSAWAPAPGMTSWRAGVPLELVRFAGANRLKVEIDFQAQDGRWGPRVVEPYSLRRTREGNLLLFVVNDRNQVRGYRLDRIRGIRPTNETFEPRFVVEF